MKWIYKFNHFKALVGHLQALLFAILWETFPLSEIVIDIGLSCLQAVWMSALFVHQTDL